MVKKKVVRKKAGKTINKTCNMSIIGCDTSCGGFAYTLGFLGSAIYFVSTSVGFWNGVLGLLKALVWPAFLVYEVLKFIGA